MTAEACTSRSVAEQINSLTGKFVELSLADDQNFSFENKTGSGRVEVTFSNKKEISYVLKNHSYRETYDRIRQERAYSIKMMDGAFIQLMYIFQSSKIKQHRLAFFPSPYLDNFQNNADIYLEDEIYADIVSRNIVAFPIRFDFDGRPGVYKDVDHPKSHLTLGQYKNCRIPVSHPVLPFKFLEFILRNFYNTAHRKYCGELENKLKVNLERTISCSEEELVYIQLPSHGSVK